MSFFYTRTRDGDEKVVGPFKTRKAAQRGIAQALTDNGYLKDRDVALEAGAMAAVGPSDIRGVTYEIHQDNQ